jgi:hypothetical protein
MTISASKIFIYKKKIGKFLTLDIRGLLDIGKYPDVIWGKNMRSGKEKEGNVKKRKKG